MRFHRQLYTDDGMIAVFDLDTGQTRLWLRGFTYKTWTCAQTGELIEIGDFAWRMVFPKNTKESRLRVKAVCFDR